MFPKLHLRLHLVLLTTLAVQANPYQSFLHEARKFFCDLMPSQCKTNVEHSRKIEKVNLCNLSESLSSNAETRCQRWRPAEPPSLLAASPPSLLAASPPPPSPTPPPQSPNRAPAPLDEVWHDLEEVLSRKQNGSNENISKTRKDSQITL